MLTDEETSLGCLAYYKEEIQRTGTREEWRNCVRNFRRGVLFGYSLKRKGFSAGSVLETGPGSGYFAAGLRFVFPGARITVMDINREVLDFNRERHGYETIEAVPDRVIDSLDGRYDLVIARDILEHVSDIKKVLQNLHACLAPGGLMHFTTPNGLEDAWKHYLAFRAGHSPSELLINHVSYFDGGGLRNLLGEVGFTPVQYYTYGIKPWLRGNGWKFSAALAANRPRGYIADKYAKMEIGHRSPLPAATSPWPEEWYVRPGAPWITWLYSFLQHQPMIRMNPDRNRGHEFYGIFRKT